MGDAGNEISKKLEELVAIAEGKEWNDFEKAFDEFLEQVNRTQRGVLILSKEDKDYVLEMFSRVVKAGVESNKSLNVLINFFKPRKHFYLGREIKTIVLEVFWRDLKLKQDDRDFIIREAASLRKEASNNDDMVTLVNVLGLFKTWGYSEEARATRLEILQISRSKGIYISPEFILGDLGDEISRMDTKLHELKKKQKILSDSYDKDKIRLVETLGLFAAIIAFVIAGIVGLQGLTATGIAISITGLTAGLVVLVTLINIFTSPKTYIWGKVAVLGIAFFTLIAWMVVTVFFKPAIFK